jgi:AcrR family transcriptional regulator
MALPLVRMGLRERKKLKTAQQLADVALDLFERQGYASTSVAQVAHAAEVSPRTLFRYFGTKEDLVFADSSRFLTAFTEMLRERPRSESRFGALKESLLSYADYIESEVGQVLRVQRLIDSSPALQKRQADELTRWWATVPKALAARRGASSPSFEDVTVMHIGISALSVAYRVWTREGGAQPLRQLVARAFSVLERETAGRTSQRLSRAPESGVES